MYSNSIENELFKLNKQLRIAKLNGHDFEIEVIKDDIKALEMELEALEG